MRPATLPEHRSFIEVRTLSLDDPMLARAVHAIQMAAYRQEADLLGVDTFPPLEQSLEDLQMSPTRFLGAWVAGDLVGALGHEPVDEPVTEAPGMLIASLVVAPPWQRRGVGRTLLDAAIQAFGSASMTVCTGARNMPALRLYQGAGFDERSRRLIGQPGIEVVELVRAKRISNPGDAVVPPVATGHT